MSSENQITTEEKVSEEKPPEKKKKIRLGFKRWIVLLLVFLGIYSAYIGPSILKPIPPTVVLPAEPIWPGVNITNTMLATIIADVVLLLMGLSAYRFFRSGKQVPSGFYNAFEAIMEFLLNSVQSATGKWIKKVIPVVATIFLLIFVANMVKLVPGFETIGWLSEAHEGVGYGTQKLISIGSMSLYTLNSAQQHKVEADHAEETDSYGDEDDFHSEETSGTAVCKVCHVIPFLRGSATDLNFTFALAVIAVLMTQVYGVWALGPGYFSKFLPFKRLFFGGAFGVIDFVVGLLELILEFAKILSFSFRLFGNIFAGALLLSIIGALLPVIIPPGLYFFEIFFGVIQAYVFFLLATMFVGMALVSHHDEGHAEAH